MAEGCRWADSDVGESGVIWSLSRPRFILGSGRHALAAGIRAPAFSIMLGSDSLEEIRDLPFTYNKELEIFKVPL